LFIYMYTCIGLCVGMVLCGGLYIYMYTCIGLCVALVWCSVGVCSFGSLAL